MGYLIKDASEWTIKTVLIPEPDVFILNGTPFELVPADPNAYILINYCVVTADINQIVPYSNFDYIYLFNDIQQIGVYEEATGFTGIEKNYFNQIALTLSHPPTLFGSQLKSGKSITLGLDKSPSLGDGNLLVTIQYKYAYS